MAKPRIAVVLSGCGVFDGAEIHEAVLTMLAIDRNGAEYKCFAPNVDQAHVINHITGEEMDGPRNAMIESSRISRGDISDLKDFDAASVDAVMFPGGFGAAKTLCTFAFDGPDCSVNPDVDKALKAMVAAKKPIGALCIAPALMAKVLEGAEVTIGQSPDVAGAIAKMGGKHSPTQHGGVVVDQGLKLVTAPCYMLDSTISQIAEGAENAVKAVLDLVKAG